MSFAQLLSCWLAAGSSPQGYSTTSSPFSDWTILMSAKFLQTKPFCLDSQECFYQVASATLVEMYIKTIMPFLFLYRFYTSPVCRGTIYCLNYLSELKWFWKLLSSPTTRWISFCASSPCLILASHHGRCVCMSVCVQDALLLLRRHKTASHVPLTESMTSLFSVHIRISTHGTIFCLLSRFCCRFSTMSNCVSEFSEIFTFEANIPYSHRCRCWRFPAVLCAALLMMRQGWNSVPLRLSLVRARTFLGSEMFDVQSGASVNAGSFLLLLTRTLTSVNTATSDQPGLVWSEIRYTWIIYY